MEPAAPDREWKKGSAELLILSLLEVEPRHGYEIGKLIEQRSQGGAALSCDDALSAALPAGKPRTGARLVGGKGEPAAKTLLQPTPQGRTVLAAPEKGTGRRSWRRSAGW